MSPAKLGWAALRVGSALIDEGEDVSVLKAQLALSALAERRADERELARS